VNPATGPEQLLGCTAAYARVTVLTRVVVRCCIIKKRLDHDAPLAADFTNAPNQRSQPRLLLWTLSDHGGSSTSRLASFAGCYAKGPHGCRLLLSGPSVLHCPGSCALSWSPVKSPHRCHTAYMACFATAKRAGNMVQSSQYACVLHTVCFSPGPCCCVGSGPCPAALRALQAQPQEDASPAPAWAEGVRRCE
jgi:hypothetical protein